MATITHKATRAAFGAAIDLAMKHVNKDRQKGLMDLVDLAEKFMGISSPKGRMTAPGS